MTEPGKREASRAGGTAADLDRLAADLHRAASTVEHTASTLRRLVTIAREILPVAATLVALAAITALWRSGLHDESRSPSSRAPA